MLNAVSDLINRRKAKIEELRSDKIIAERHEKDARDLFVDCTRQLEEANAEIEGLEETRYELACIIDDLREEHNRLLQKLQQAQSEAIKEFAERLKEYELCMFCSFPDNKSLGSEQYIVLSDSIDNLVKEMTEE